MPVTEMFSGGGAEVGSAVLTTQSPLTIPHVLVGDNAALRPLGGFTTAPWPMGRVLSHAMPYSEPLHIRA